MDRLFTTLLATISGTIVAVFGVQVDALPASAPSVKTIELTPLATTTTEIATTTTTTTIVLPATVPVDESKRCPKYEALFAKHQLPVEIFSYIAWRESGCNPKAINATWGANGRMTYHLNKNKSWDTGLLQINSSWLSAVRSVCNVNTGDKRKDLEVLFDPECNVRFAKWIMDNTSGQLKNWSL